MCREAVKIIKTKSAEEALRSLMHQCARAEKSSGDAMRLMARWGVPSEQRCGVLERLIAEKFIDDRRFAEAYVREKLNLSGWGVRKIASSLKAKGVSSSIVEESLSQLDLESMVGRLEDKIKRKLRTVKYKDNYDLKSKLVRYALSLGYDYDMVFDAVSQQVKINDDE
ncbi:MAG: regulatory protein RecX [Rikenellaceae bacterium]